MQSKEWKGEYSLREQVLLGMGTNTGYREKEISDSLETVNRFFKALGIPKEWMSYDENMDTNRKSEDKYQYFSELIRGCSVQFKFPDRTRYAFFPKFPLQEQVFFDPNEVKKIESYDDEKFALAQICVEYIKKRVMEIDKKYPVYEQKIQKMRTHEEIVATFHQALGSKPRNDQFKLWTTYWSKPNAPSSCYSCCSGSCGASCQGKTCLYFFTSYERSNPNLPDAEQVDPRNIFDDRAYWIAQTFAKYLETRWLH